MNASDRRRTEDVRRLRELARASEGRIRIEGIDGEPPRAVRLRLNYPTATNDSYPAGRSESSQVRIDFPARYPMLAPKATVLTPIFHPNVYTSGLICLGDTWLPGETLDALVRRIIRLITFDPLISGGEPPANQSAMRWYRSMLSSRPQIFPTASVSFPKADTRTDAGIRFDSDRVERTCPECDTRLTLPPGRSGSVRCPGCSTRFTTQT